MPKIGCFLVAGLLLLSAIGVQAEEPALQVYELIIAAGVNPAAREPLDPGTEFPNTSGSVYCYSRITGAAVPTTITHVWYYEGETMARVELPVRSMDWRTWSSKRLLPSWTGHWQVKILDEDGLVLKAASFQIVEPEGAAE
jgi:DUF2914 family protein